MFLSVFRSPAIANGKLEQGNKNIHALAAFSGEVEFNAKDPNATHLLSEKFTETNMNPNLKGRDLRKAFYTDDYREYVQTLSRLNRDYLNNKAIDTFVLDFFNEPEDILGAFQPYHQAAELTDVSDPYSETPTFRKRI